MFTIPIEPVFAFLLVFVRVVFLFAFLPVYGEVFTPVRVRALLSLAVALVMAPLVRFDPAATPHSTLDFAALMVPEALLGMAMGFVGRLFFAAVQFAGKVVGEQIGFGMANAIDPTQTAQIPVVGQMLFIASLLVFLGVDGDHQFLSALARSFQEAPPGSLGVPEGLAHFFNQQATEMFIVAVQISLPFMAVFFVMNVGMGMLAKGAPTINVFIERFPIGIILGLFLLSVVSNFIVKLLVEGLVEMRSDLSDLVRLFS